MTETLEQPLDLFAPKVMTDESSDRKWLEWKINSVCEEDPTKSFQDFECLFSKTSIKNSYSASDSAFSQTDESYPSEGSTNSEVDDDSIYNSQASLKSNLDFSSNKPNNLEQKNENLINYAACSSSDKILPMAIKKSRSDLVLSSGARENRPRGRLNASIKGKRAKSPHPLKDFVISKPQEFTTDKNINSNFFTPSKSLNQLSTSITSSHLYSKANSFLLSLVEKTKTDTAKPKITQSQSSLNFSEYSQHHAKYKPNSLFIDPMHAARNHSPHHVHNYGDSSSGYHSNSSQISEENELNQEPMFDSELQWDDYLPTIQESEILPSKNEKYKNWGDNAIKEISDIIKQDEIHYASV